MTPLSLVQIRKKLKAFGSRKKRRLLMRFFKCGVGEYGFGDQFWGVTVPQIRSLISEARHLTLVQLNILLDSKIHEERLLALLLLEAEFRRVNSKQKKKIFYFYLRRRDAVNNWDLVDLTASKIVGAHLYGNSYALLDKLAGAKRMWCRRIAIVATHHFIRQGELQPTFKLVEKLMHDPEDLMHKACGWMLREAGKKDERALKAFLRRHATKMPRTMLRYAIEKFPEAERKKYLGIKKTI